MIHKRDIHTDRQTDTAWRHRPRLCIASRGNKTGAFQNHQQSTKENTLCFLSLHTTLFAIKGSKNKKANKRKKKSSKGNHCNYLKSNKVSKSEGTRKNEYAYHF